MNVEEVMSEPTKPLEATLVLRNNRLKKEREKYKLSQHRMAELIGIPLQVYGEAECLRQIPNNYKKKIAEFFEQPVEYFFSEMVESVKQTRFRKEVEVAELVLAHAEQLKQLDYLSPEKNLENESLGGEIEEVLSTLTERERDIIRERFGLQGGIPKSLSELGKQFHVGRERVRQIEKDAIRKMRGPSRSRYLKSFVTEVDHWEDEQKTGLTKESCYVCRRRKGADTFDDKGYRVNCSNEACSDSWGWGPRSFCSLHGFKFEGKNYCKFCYKKLVKHVHEEKGRIGEVVAAGETSGDQVHDPSGIHDA